MLKVRLDQVVLPLVERFSGRCSVALEHPDGFHYLLNARTAMPSASLIKLAILSAVLERVDRGEYDLSRRVALAKDAQAGGSGVLKLLQPGLEPSLEDLLTLMITLSDNTATNMLLDLIGLEAVNAHIGALGLEKTKLVGKLQPPSHRANEAQRRGERNRSCAADILSWLTRLENGDLLSAPSTRLALSILKKQQHGEALARHLPTDAELDSRPVAIASKSGCLRGTWHDAALIYDAESLLYALVVMTTDAEDRRFGYEQEGMMLIAEVAARVHEVLVADS